SRWERLPGLPAGGQNPYLHRKGVEAFGVKFDGSSLIVPLRDVEGKLWSLQTIMGDDSGAKRFAKGGRIKGMMHLIGEPRPGEPSDFNDLQACEGLDVVKQQLDEVMGMTTRQSLELARARFPEVVEQLAQGGSAQPGTSALAGIEQRSTDAVPMPRNALGASE